MSKEKAVVEFQAACEKYLRDSGWEENGSHWEVPKRFGVYAGDLVFLWNAVTMQQEADAKKFKK